MLRIIVHPENRGCEILPLLDALSCRAVLLKAEARSVDAKYKFTLPISLQSRGSVSFGLKTLPFRLLPLTRYAAVSKALVEDLIPMTPRAIHLLNDFLALRDGPLNFAEHLICPRNPAYLPDTAIGLSESWREAAPALQDTTEED